MIAQVGVAATTSQAASPVIAALTLMVGWLRVVRAVSKEFDKGDPVVSNPVLFVTGGRLTWEEFASDNFKGFAALSAAFDLSRFLEHYGAFLDPKYGTLGFSLIFAFYVFFFVQARLSGVGAAAELNPALLVALLTAVWMLLVERAKELKRLVARTRLRQ